MASNTIIHPFYGEGTCTALSIFGRLKLHMTFKNNSIELIEEFDETSQVLLLRKRRSKSDLGKQNDWTYEVGESEKQFDPNKDAIVESQLNPIFVRQDSPTQLIFRIRHLFHPPEVYSVSIENNSNNKGQSIVVRTSNRKYYKRIEIPEMNFLSIPLESKDLQWKYANNTLIITYCKPNKLVEIEARQRQERQKLNLVN